MRLSPAVASGGYSLLLHGFPSEVASLVVERGLYVLQALVAAVQGLSSCGLRALGQRLSSCDTQA